jgi:hypothetical protein
MAKKWLFWFCEGSVCVSGQNQMCRLCGCLKLFLKNAGRQKKIKKHWGGLSVGLLAVPFQYGLYVFGHLSKWFVFVLMFKFWSVYRLWNGRPTIGYNVLQLGVVAELEALNCQFSTIVDLKNYCSFYHVTRHYAKLLLCAALLLCRQV